MIKVFEAFAGYGSQAMALKRAGIPHQVVGISEIDRYAIQAYNAVHGETVNYGDISKIDWMKVPDFDMFTYSFPCFVAGTLVLTKRGYIPIEEIDSSDYVLSHTNELRKVITPMAKPYIGNMCSIKAMGFHHLVCTPEHPFYAIKRYRYGHKRERMFTSPEWIHAEHLTKDHFLGYAINKESKLPVWEGVSDNRWGHGRPVNTLSKLFTNKTFWYIMGRYVGDGWKRNNGIIICCSKRNEDSLSKALTTIGWKSSRVKERNITKYHICGKEICSFVDRFGYKAHGKKIDMETMSLPSEFLVSFMEGVVDSDGFFTKGLFKVSTVSKELAYGYAQCVAKAYHRPFSIYLTKRNNTSFIENRKVTQRDTYTVTWKLTEDRQDKAFYKDGYVWFPIRSICMEYAETSIFNMSVETDESYTANGCIVHNCQDISNAGLQRGFTEGSGTRSGLLWECRKAIEAKKPKFLLMENVKALLSKKFMPEFLKWEAWLREQGYSNFWQVLNAKDYGVPQNRERAFMVSILGEGWYTFPEKIPLEKRLKDVLEDNVDEKYYLSEKALEKMTLAYSRSQTGIVYVGDTNKGGERGAILSTDGICTSLSATDYKQPKQIICKLDNQEPTLRILQDTKQRIVEPLNDQEGLCRTLKSQYQKNSLANFTRQGSMGATAVIEYTLRIPQATKQGYAEVKPGSVFDASYPDSKTRRGRVQEGGAVYPALTSRGEPPCYYDMAFRIRKLTPRECFRLMGVSDADIDRIQAAGISNSQQYKLAGNSIVVDVLEAIFRNLFFKPIIKTTLF